MYTRPGEASGGKLSPDEMVTSHRLLRIGLSRGYERMAKTGWPVGRHGTIPWP